MQSRVAQVDLIFQGMFFSKNSGETVALIFSVFKLVSDAKGHFFKKVIFFSFP
jgi:hypothetical protein